MAFASALDPFTLGAVERQFLAVHRKEVLSEKFTKVGKDAAEPADDRIIPADRIMGLTDVDDEQNNRDQSDDAD